METADWQDLLRHWNLGDKAHKFQINGFLDPYDWVHLDDVDLRNCGLNKRQAGTFKTLTDQWTRKQWGRDSAVQIFSQSKAKWFDGIITDTLTDAEGEWLTIRYNKSTSKQVQRFCEDIRAPPKEKRSPSKPQHRPRSTSVSIDAPVDYKLITDLSINERKAQEKKKALNSTQNSNHQTSISPVTDRETRAAWTKGEYVEVYSRSRQKWLLGSINDIGNDEEGEFLEVHYHDQQTGQNSKKRVGRFEDEIRAVSYETDEFLTGVKQTDNIAGVQSPPKMQTIMQPLVDESPRMDQEEESDEHDYPENAISIQYRMKDLGFLRQLVLLKEGSVAELEEQIRDLQNFLNQEIIELREARTRLKKEEKRFLKQSHVLLRSSRKKWKRGSWMEVYSKSRQEWYLAECQDVFEDAEGEWLQVMYCVPSSKQTIMKQIQRFSDELRPCEVDRTPPVSSSSLATLPRINEIPTKEDIENESWRANQKDDFDFEIPSLDFEINVPTEQVTVPVNEKLRRRQSHAITEEEEFQLEEMKGREDKLYIIYQNQATEIKVNLSLNCAHLKAQIQKKLQIEVGKQELYFNDHLLKSNESLRDYCKNDSTLYLKVKDKNTKQRKSHSRAARGSHTIIDNVQYGGESSI